MRQQLLSEFHEEIQEVIIPEKFWDEISIFSGYEIFIGFSGGIDSSIVVKVFLEKGIKFNLIWNDTRRSMKTARNIIARMFRVSGSLFHITYPEEDQKVITEKTRENIRRIIRGEITKNKHNIPCCRYLKEDPFLDFIKQHTDPNSLFISSIAAYEGNQRDAFLRQIRNKGTFLHYHVTKDRWFGYPLRDYIFKTEGKFLKSYAQLHITGVDKSGCHSCPIPAMYDNLLIEEDNIRLERSKKVWLSNDA